MSNSSKTNSQKERKTCQIGSSYDCIKHCSFKGILADSKSLLKKLTKTEKWFLRHLSQLSCTFLRIRKRRKHFMEKSYLKLSQVALKKNWFVSNITSQIASGDQWERKKIEGIFHLCLWAVLKDWNDCGSPLTFFLTPQ